MQMQELIDMSFLSLDNYFEGLANAGYLNYGQVKKLMALLIVENIVSDFWLFIDEKDYKKLLKVLSCLYGTCLIGFPLCKDNDQLHNIFKDKPVRISEYGIVRIDSEIRSKN